MSLTDVNDFDPSFASPADWAIYYRSQGFQIVPGRDPVAGQPWKMPSLAWKEWSTGELVPQAIWEKWYAHKGTYALKPNMGILTGRVSRGIFILDLDDHKTDAAQTWWRGLLAVHNNNSEPETPQQITGGGGRQLLFRAPEGWLAPTNAMSALGVDIRGEGGFAVLPPSRHSSGQNYAWKDGCAPWEMEIADAPQWLCEAIDTLVARHGSKPDGERTIAQVTPSPGADFNPFGQRIDGRDKAMRDLIWATMLEWRNECPLPPDNKTSRDKMFAAFDTYARKTKSRLAGEYSNEDKLELEGRGITLFSEKWAYALRKWDTDIARAAKAKRETEAPPPPPPQLDAAGKPLPLVLTPAQFVAGFTPPEYLWDGIMQRGFLYALTARTGHGKTAVTMMFGLHIAQGETFHNLDVKQGTVLLLAGENPDDVRARFIVACHSSGLDPLKVKMRFVAGVVDIAASMPVIRAEAETITDLVLVIVDTAAAYFRGDDTNSNSQQGDYARLLRQLTFLPGKPAVLVNCHPIKNASRDNLLPMGGSAFLNEIDGNLTLWANTEKQTTLHWLGKFRGPEFEPLAFEMVTVTSEQVRDANGRDMPSVIARSVSEIQIQMAENEQDRDVKALLNFIARDRNASLSALAIKCNFINPKGRPLKAKVQRIGAKLLADKLVESILGKFHITPKGKKYIGWEDET